MVPNVLIPLLLLAPDILCDPECIRCLILDPFRID